MLHSKSLKSNDVFRSPSRGQMSFDSVVYDLVDYMESKPKNKYVVVVGTDSKLYREESLFVSIIFIHRVGYGARYFYQRKQIKIGKKLRPRIYEEANLSLELGQKLIHRLQSALHNANLNYDFEIHVDIGKGGPTKEMIKEIVGMIEGNGFVARYKPDSYGASIVADRHT